MSAQRATNGLNAMLLALSFIAATLLAHSGPTWSEQKQRDMPQAQDVAAIAVVAEVRTPAPLPDISDDPVAIFPHSPFVALRASVAPHPCSATVISLVSTNSPWARGPPSVAL